MASSPGVKATALQTAGCSMSGQLVCGVWVGVSLSHSHNSLSLFLLPFYQSLAGNQSFPFRKMMKERGEDEDGGRDQDSKCQGDKVSWVNRQGPTGCSGAKCHGISKKSERWYMQAEVEVQRITRRESPSVGGETVYQTPNVSTRCPVTQWQQHAECQRLPAGKSADTKRKKGREKKIKSIGGGGYCHLGQAVRWEEKKEKREAWVLAPEAFPQLGIVELLQ